MRKSKSWAASSSPYVPFQRQKEAKGKKKKNVFFPLEESNESQSPIGAEAGSAYLVHDRHVGEVAAARSVRRRHLETAKKVNASEQCERESNARESNARERCKGNWRAARSQSLLKTER